LTFQIGKVATFPDIGCIHPQKAFLRIAMLFLEKTLPTLVENVALDEALLLDAEAGGPEVLRLWEWRGYGVVVGAAGRLAQEVDEPACLAEGIPMVRRSSGGGAVLLGPGCLSFSLVLRFDRNPALADLHASYRFILGHFERSLSATFQGASDLAIDARKFSGNAQQRKRTHLLHHGTLLYAFEIDKISRYLKSPPREPDYRRGRSHEEFVTNLSMERQVLVQAIKDAWATNGMMMACPLELTRKLVEEKYATAEWLRRR
jgi:lipoate-protein ligase A